MSRLWAVTVDFDSIEPGDTLPVIIKWETEESIQRYTALYGEGGDEFGASASDALPPKTVEGYVTELLSKGFPPESLQAEGSSLDVEYLRPILANDTISLSAWVVDKRRDAEFRLVECVVAVENDRGEPVARARAVVSLG